MPSVFIGKIQAPEQVLPRTPFKIIWDIWYLGWPFKKTNILSMMTWDNEIINKMYPTRIWFIGKMTQIASISGIENDTIFTISVGWRD